MSEAAPEPIWVPNPGPQTNAWLCEAMEVFFGGSRGSGKAQKVLSEQQLENLRNEHPGLSDHDIRMKYEGHVLTPFGFRPMGETQVGDAVCNPDGTICHVIAVHPITEKDYFRLEFIDGATVECCEDHLWAVSVSNSPVGKKRGVDDVSGCDLSEETKWNIRYSQRCRVMDTKEVARRHAIAETQKENSEHPEWLKVPLCRPCEMNGSKGRGNPVPPYTMGVLLGDGNLSGSTAEWSKPEPEIAGFVQEEIAAHGLPFEVVPHQDGTVYSVTGGLMAMVEAMGLKGKRSWEKFIPSFYLRAPKAIRWAIAQGLMDTDGYADETGHIEYCTTSERLAKDVRFLLRSLGFTATIMLKEGPTYTYLGETRVGRPAYRIYVKGADTKSLFKLARKADRCRRYNGGVGDAEPFNRIVSVTPIGKHTGRCITVSHPNGLYITNDFVVTHNSAFLFGKVIQHVSRYRGRSKMIFFRENVDDLGDLIEKGKTLLEQTGMADYISGQSRVFRFKGPFDGATLKMRHLEHIDDLKAYKGHEYTLIGIDEVVDLGLPLDAVRDAFLACLRNPHGIPGQILYTGNPGGYNHAAVKAHFIDPWPAGQRILRNEHGQTRCFFQATVKDNPKLANDPLYRAQLDGIRDPILRRAWRDGDWTVAVGSMFGDVFSTNKHVLDFSITANDIPNNWKRFRALDWGSSTPFCCLWYTIATGEETNSSVINKKIKQPFPAGAIIFYREAYGWKPGNGRNEGLKLGSSEVAEMIHNIELYEGENGRVLPGPADNQIFAVLDGTPIYQNFYIKGVRFVESNKSPGSIATGCELLRDRFIGEDGRPLIYYTRDCPHCIRTIPVLARDKINPEIPAPRQEDHCFAVSRYVVLAVTQPTTTVAEMAAELSSREAFERELCEAS